MSALVSPTSHCARLFPFLKAHTAAQRCQLDQHLGLLVAPLSRQRFIRVLARFVALLRVWEPSIAQHRTFTQLMKTRVRRPLAERDLRMLGASEAQRGGVVCETARRLVKDAPSAMGYGWDEATWPAIADGARQTFAFLDRWLTEDESE
jgi:heme oxygenase